MNITRSAHHPWPRRSLFIVSLLLSALSASTQANVFERLFVPKAEYWEFWDTRDPDDSRQIDHLGWDSFLGSYVLPGEDGINRVRYASVSDADRQLLRDYINTLEQLPIRQYNSAQQLAYWINLYNAVTIDVVLQYYPVDSIRDIDISPGFFFADGPWKKKLLTIEGEPLSLNDIEHRILRPVWQDPRLHYALNCASTGCPNLSNRAYLADTMDTRLDQAAISYINHPRGVSFDKDKLTVSSIYSWFREDFGESDAAVIAHLQGYAKAHLRDTLADSERIAGYRYDWSLNDTP